LCSANLVVDRRSKGRTCRLGRLPRIVDGSFRCCSLSPLQAVDAGPRDRVWTKGYLHWTHSVLRCRCRGYFTDLCRSSHWNALTVQGDWSARTSRVQGLDIPLYVVTLFTGIKASLVYAETDIKYLVPSAQHNGFQPRERSHVGWPLYHFFLEVDGSAVDHEGAVPVVMDHPAFLALRISPGLDYFQDEEVVLVDQAVV
jgi:hypothetical protein